MTLITISHLGAAANQLHACSPAEPDRFSLNSNLSGSSPHSSLTSPLSAADFNGSPASICCSSSCRSSSSSSGDGGAACEHIDNTLEKAVGCEHNATDHDEQLHSAPSSGQHSPANENLIVPDYHHHLHRHAHQLRQPSEDDDHNQIKSLTATNSNNNNSQKQQQDGERQAISLSPRAAELCPKVRRLSRSEHRQSLSDLGYGKIESYVKLQRLGKGTYATVYMGRSRLSNDLVALKEILKEHDEGAPCTAIREVSLLRLLRHNNIVTLHDICHTPKKLTLVFEYVGPDLYAYMKENNHLLSIHNVRVS